MQYRLATLEAEIQAHAREPITMGRILGYAVSAVREGVERAGQMAPILRHTFASHFDMQDGNILTLQRSLEHANVTMTCGMRICRRSICKKPRSSTRWRC